MKSYIKAIIIFDKNGDKRTVKFKQGVNIITGESKTGKSAIVEIIDYCLCSNRCTIPKGKITEFAHLYAMVISINCNTYVIVRQNMENGGKMLFYKEDNNYNGETLKMDFLIEKKFLPCREVKNDIELTLGLNVSNVLDGDNKKKASLRNMVSFMFQHQNLIASKFALFYRFSDFYKRKDTIEQFPVFAGFISQEYYSCLIELNALKQELKLKIRNNKMNENSKIFIEENFKSILSDYFALIDKEFDNSIGLNKMINIASNLPKYKNECLTHDEKIIERYHRLQCELKKLKTDEHNVLLKIDELKDTGNNGDDYIETLMYLKHQTKVSTISGIDYSCPVCGRQCNEIKENDTEILNALKWLDKELTITENTKIDFHEDIRKLNDIHKKIVSKIKYIYKQLKIIEEQYIYSNSLLSKKEKIDYAEAKICIYLELYNNGIIDVTDGDLTNTEILIKKLTEKISCFNFENKMKEAEEFINSNMNKLATTLDFEDEFKPIDLKFELTNGNYDIYQLQHNKDKVYLSEMGSGANWISCHIALFLSFLHFFTNQNDSSIPTIMFFDQPSQVYFPERSNKDNPSAKDLDAVSNIYTTIFNEIKSIETNTGVLPQIIIVDHVDGSLLKCKEEFESHICCNWRNGDALI